MAIKEEWIQGEGKKMKELDKNVFLIAEWELFQLLKTEEKIWDLKAI